MWIRLFTDPAHIASYRKDKILYRKDKILKDEYSSMAVIS